jgi:hypothetical protein
MSTIEIIGGVILILVMVAFALSVAIAIEPKKVQNITPKRTYESMSYGELNELYCLYKQKIEAVLAEMKRRESEIGTSRGNCRSGRYQPNDDGWCVTLKEPKEQKDTLKFMFDSSDRSGDIHINRLIDVDFLQRKHPELSLIQAESLLKFCNEHTITHKECYGQGEIMYPKWKESIK